MRKEKVGSDNITRRNEFVFIVDGEKGEEKWK